MPASKAEQILDALKALLGTVPGAVVERNSVLPEKVPDGGLIILRDGDPGEPEQALGGFGGTYYQHAVEIEVYVEEGDAAARDAAFRRACPRARKHGLMKGRHARTRRSSVSPPSRRSSGKEYRTDAGWSQKTQRSSSIARFLRPCCGRDQRQQAQVGRPGAVRLRVRERPSRRP